MWGLLSGIVGLLNWVTGFSQRWRERAAEKRGEAVYKLTVEAVKQRNEVEDEVDRASDARVSQQLRGWSRDQ